MPRFATTEGAPGGALSGLAAFPDGGNARMNVVPDAGQLSQVMSQATAPAFVLGAVAAFVAVLLNRMTSVIAQRSADSSMGAAKGAATVRLRKRQPSNWVGEFDLTG
jgi:hypothetical protein